MDCLPCTVWRGQAHAALSEERQRGVASRESYQRTAQQMTTQRDAALQEVTSLAQELDDLHSALGSPPRWKRQSFGDGLLTHNVPAPEGHDASESPYSPYQRSNTTQ